MLAAGESGVRKRSLTDFGGGHRDVVPHVRLPVQRFSQCDLPIVHVDVELPLQVRVPIDEIPAKTIYGQTFEPGLFRDPPMQHFVWRSNLATKRCL